MEADTAQGAARRAAPTSEVLDGLNDLLQLDHDAIGAYDIAIDKLENRDQSDQIVGFKLDHERHVDNLTNLITELGGTPKNKPHATGPLKQGLQSLGSLAGDKGVLVAFRTNELQVRTKYDNYASKAVFWPDNVKRVIDENALDEERHYQWVADVLERMGGGGGDLGSRARGAADQAKHKASDIADQAKQRVHGATESARDRYGDEIETATEKRDEIEQRIREHPLQALLILFAAGFVLGRVLR